MWGQRSRCTLTPHVTCAAIAGSPEKHNIFRFHLDVIPRSIERVFASGKLRELWLTNNHFNVIPAFVEQLPNLQTLCLSGNQLSSISRPLFKCTKLQRLLLARNHIVALPPEFAELTELRELRLDHNQLARFPSAVCSLRSLRRLGLSFNRIDSVPPRVRRLTNLIELDLDNNRVRSGCCEQYGGCPCTHVVVLQIGPELPVELMRLSGLTVLGVANNCLEAAPPLGKRPPGAVPLSVVRLSGNRSSKYKVYHDSGMLLEGENIPVRARLRMLHASWGTPLCDHGAMIPSETSGRVLGTAEGVPSD